MAKSDYINPNDNAFGAQLTTFKTTIGSYSATLGVSAAQVTAQAADADYFNYIVSCQTIMQNGAQQWTAWKDLIRGGGTPPPSGIPSTPTFPAAVPAVAPGIEGRFRALVKQIKANANYNQAIGQALGIEGAQQTGPDLSTIQPDIDATLSGSNVLVGEDKNKLISELENILAGNAKRGAIPPLWDGRAGERIADVLQNLS